MNYREAREYIIGLSAFLRAQYNVADDEERKGMDVSVKCAEGIMIVIDRLDELERENDMLKIEKAASKEFNKSRFGQPL